jgi:hypothetical protein
MMESDEQSIADSDPENKVIYLGFCIYIYKSKIIINYRFFLNLMNIFELYPANKFDRD